ncbi:GntR family transcriptional regulator [Comamonadaceae bacterium G21597-S1]|nr:GntR family transcriptional regulator [Comamonadaceae bacterium G21597-S1]
MNHPEPLAQIARIPLHEEVTNRIRDMIVESKLAPGERIQEMQLAQQLGVSRTPIREALKVLTAEGLVELLPLRGAIVKVFTDKDARDMLDVIALIEAFAGERACQADAARIDEVIDMHRRMRTLYDQRQRLDYFVLNQRIHEALVALADNDTLSQTHATLSKRMRSLRYSGNSGAENWAAAMAEHEQMIAALERRDAAALARAMREHIQNTWPRIRDVTQSTPG